MILWQCWQTKDRVDSIMACEQAVSCYEMHVQKMTITNVKVFSSISCITVDEYGI